MVRTRFAPSPTGSMHIGNLRTALYAWLFARGRGGRFVLRIEDTDRKRHVPGAVQVILDSLRLAGLDYDEGPDKDGGFGPYVQSERKPLYRPWIDELLERGGAYHCFCADGKDAMGRVDAMDDMDNVDGMDDVDNVDGMDDVDSGDRMSRNPQPPIPNPQSAIRNPQSPIPNPKCPCRELTRTESARRAAAGEPFVVRQRIPEEGETSFFDHVFGRVTVRNAQLDDQVLLKSDGYPTYNFANVVDDHLMAITHVVRGVEYLSSTPKYNLLYQTFGWDIPEYVHLPHIKHESGRKLSKREGDASFQDLIAMGYLPAAIANYVALLGWNPGDEREFFTLEDLIAAFDIDRINKSSAAFSFAKLDWLNGEHLRRLDPQAFHELARAEYPPELVRAGDPRAVSHMIQPRVVRLSEIPQMVKFLVEIPDYAPDLFVHPNSKSTLDSSRRVLAETSPIMRGLPDWNHDALHAALMGYARSGGLKTGTVMWPLRIALSGQTVTPGGALEIALALGRDETLRRVQAGLDRLKAV